MDVLLVEDDLDIANFVTAALEDNSYTVEHVTSGREGLFAAASTPYDIIILDRLLPGGIDGLKILEILRNQGNTTPVLLLSGLGDVEEKVKGLRAGGSDYLAKPFAIAELMARIEALTRPRNGKSAQTELVVGDLEMNLLTRRVKRAGQKIDLQQREFRLLEYLMRHPGQALTRTMLLEAVWEYHFDPGTNLIEVHVSRLRQKIEEPFRDQILHTIRNVGYMLRPKNVAAQA
jgi:two-component system OmpR family response regulator